MSSRKQQSELVAQQLNAQLAQMQQQIDIYKQQMAQYENASQSNQQQLVSKVQQQELTIQILVEEKAELSSRVRSLEEAEITFKADLESARKEQGSDSSKRFVALSESEATQSDEIASLSIAL